MIFVKTFRSWFGSRQEVPRRKIIFLPCKIDFDPSIFENGPSKNGFSSHILETALRDGFREAIKPVDLKNERSENVKKFY
ncbi:MAG: hypothetical protein IKR18_03300, partial [Bacteroidaceae bacterium]|nr:hypothetical protein [Bacteroidaceae bacterium]